MVSGESRLADTETVEDWKNYHILQEIEGDIHNADKTGLFFNLQPYKIFTF
jgi:hypothetical protein